jgi:N-acetylglucosaminyl-diphospho-decaprenol L-rhamnosyltransferase
MTAASIIVPTHGRPDLLRSVLEAADKQSDDSYEIIVVSDGCAESVATVQGMTLRHPCRLYDTGHTTGFGAAIARNVGARFSVGSLLIFLDADCLPGPEHVAAYRAAADGDALMLGPIEYVDPSDWSRVIEPELRAPLRHGPLVPADTRQLSWLAAHCWSGNMAVPRQRFCEIGGFDQAFVGQGGEDVDFGLRYACRFRRITVVAAAVRHVGPTSVMKRDDRGVGPFETSRIDRQIAERHYRPGAEGLIVNGGVAYFDDSAAWTAYRDLLS